MLTVKPKNDNSLSLCKTLFRKSNKINPDIHPAVVAEWLEH